MRRIGKYQNGNYTVEILEDGTKIRDNHRDDDLFVPEFAESCDVNITQRCDGNCPFCYASCTLDGKHGDILTPEFLNTLHQYTEMAINGNDLSHPDLIPFLELLKSKSVITNMTVSQKHFMKNYRFLKELIDDKLIYGLGISLTDFSTKGFYEMLQTIPNANAVVHTIVGVTNATEIRSLCANGIKTLILGYKRKGRGADWCNEKNNVLESNLRSLRHDLPEFLFNKCYDSKMGFDNLALEQLGVKSLLAEEDWNRFYMGDEGSSTFYIDLVSKTFARSSLETENFPLLNSIDEMFRFIREKYIHEVVDL